MTNRISTNRLSTNRISTQRSRIKAPKQEARPNRPRGTSSRWQYAQTIPKHKVKELHQHDRTPTKKLLIDFTMLAVVSVGAVITWSMGYHWITILLWIAAGALAHIKPLAFHDAAHGTLYPNERINEILGVGIATAIGVPLGLYRYAHAQHHTNIATEKDPELWPFTIVGTPKWLRRLTAFFEITFGFIVTPLMFFRAYLVAGDELSPKARKRIRWEYIASAFVWGSVFCAATVLDCWNVVVVGVVVPWAIAGVFQTTNKYVEHMGLMGVGVMASSRSVIPGSKVGEAFSTTWQNVAHHGTHHLYAKIPHYNLPEASEFVFSENPPEGTLFSTYTGALLAMIKTLGDPKIGPQWKSKTSETTSNE